MKKHLRALSKWSKFVGLIGLFIGAFLSLLGFTLFYIGALPGLFIVLLSVRLLRASKSAKRLNYNLRLFQNEKDIYDETFIMYASFFRLQAFVILFILAMGLSIGVMAYFYPMDYLTLIKEQFKEVVPFL